MEWLKMKRAAKETSAPTKQRDSRGRLSDEELREQGRARHQERVANAKPSRETTASKKDSRARRHDLLDTGSDEVADGRKDFSSKPTSRGREKARAGSSNDRTHVDIVSNAAPQRNIQSLTGTVQQIQESLNADKPPQNPRNKLDNFRFPGKSNTKTDGDVPPPTRPSNSILKSCKIILQFDIPCVSLHAA